jgi:hypothetical protein
VDIHRKKIAALNAVMTPSRSTTKYGNDFPLAKLTRLVVKKGDFPVTVLAGRSVPSRN